MSILLHFACSEVNELKQRLQVMEEDLLGRAGSLREREEELAAIVLRERQLQQQLQVSVMLVGIVVVC